MNTGDREILRRNGWKDEEIVKLLPLRWRVDARKFEEENKVYRHWRFIRWLIGKGKLEP